MPNPFKSKPGSKKLNDPVSQCPLNKAEIRIEVYGIDPRGQEPRRPIAGVDVDVNGATATKAAKTPANGQWRYQPLTPGPYTVTAGFPSDLDERYDITNVAAQVKTPAAGGSETAVFLVPWTWVEFIVKDTALQTLANIDWKLARQPMAGGVFTKYDSGITVADGKVYRKEVRTGTHEFTVKDLTMPQWSATEAVIGEEIVLSARTDGFEAGDVGSFEIVDAYNVVTILEILGGKVKSTGGFLQLEAKWKPKESSFTNLKQSRIMFRASAGKAVTYSGEVPLLKNEVLKFEDQKGHAMDRQFDLYFSGGTHRAITTVSGKADVQVPWGETLLWAKFPGLTVAQVKVEAGANTGAIVV